MSRVETLLEAYSSFVRIPWESNLAGPQRVWFAVYDPSEERRLRFRLAEFEVATKNAGHGWALVDLTDAFGEWLGAHEYRDDYFEDPSALELDLKEGFAASLAVQISRLLEAPSSDERAVVAVAGVASLFGLTRLSALVERVVGQIRGRFLVFFPGSHVGATYHLLETNDGWSYLAVPISGAERGRLK